MCGIVGGFSDKVSAGVEALLHRGPDAQNIVKIGKLHLGHTRLAILDLDSRSDQPFVYKGITLVFNGEIWNFQHLKAELTQLGHTFNTLSDTEVLAASLYEWGLNALPMLDGMFSIAWTNDGHTLYLARDRYGEIPLHIARQKPFLFASELKALVAMGANPKAFDTIGPGHYAEVTPRGLNHKAYYNIPLIKSPDSRTEAARNVYSHIETGTINRGISDVPVCTLLSGGIDSAAVAYHLKKVVPGLTAYTAVYDPKSRDLKCARQIASMLGIPLIEVKIPTPTPDDLSQVIQCIEMDYKAQVEIGWACLKLAEQMQRDGFKVTFSGEGSDELWASYGFAYHALLKEDWHVYRRDLFLSQSRKNFIRCNKIFMAHSIECRLPFLHYPLVEYAISLKKDSVQNTKSKPKAVIQEAYKAKLPSTIIDRPKVAFQDGLGLKTAIADHVLASPKRFYTAEFNRLYAHP